LGTTRLGFEEFPHENHAKLVLEITLPRLLNLTPTKGL
jgi:hypothetical protein